MPRISRVVAIGYPHHITQRGNYRQEIFFDNGDRQKYLSLLQAESTRYKLKLLAYCLMANHVHFIVVPERKDSMGNVFKYASMKYSQYFNKKIGNKGHLFQGRYFSSIMDERHMMVCARYIERNPVRAEIVKDACDWNWSSAKEHCGLKEDSFGVNQLFQYMGDDYGKWKDFIAESDNLEDIIEIRKQTKKGRPLGETNFVKRLEKKLNRSLILRPRGRPKKKKIK